MAKKNIKGLAFGALAGTLLGTLSTLLMPQQRRLTKQFRDKAQALLNRANVIKENVMDTRTWTEPKSNKTAKGFLIGSTIGLLIGAGSALLLAPKTGKKLREQLGETYQDVADKTVEILDTLHLNQYNHHPRHKHKAKKSKARVLSRSR